MPKARTVEFSQDPKRRPARRSAIQEAIEGLEPPQRAAIRDRASQIPQRYTGGYLRAVSGKGRPKDAIKAFCLECVGWQRAEVTQCTALGCPLYTYRPFQDS